MDIFNHIGELPQAHWIQPGLPDLIVLHDTDGPTLKDAVDTLIDRGLGYHYIIDLNGDIYQYYRDTAAVNHALKNNVRSIGISLVGGNIPITDIQIKNLIALIQLIIQRNPTVDKLTSHKECDHHLPYPEGKIDPQFKDFESTMDYIAQQTNLFRKL